MRALLVVLTALCVACSSGTVCAIALTDLFHSVRRLDAQAQGSVQSLAGAMMQQSLAEATVTVGDYFGVVAQLSLHQLDLLHELGIGRTSLADPTVRDQLLRHAIKTLRVFPQASIITLSAADGSLVAVRSGFPAYAMAVDTNFTVLLWALDDNSRGVLGEPQAYPNTNFDMRTSAFFRQAAAQQPNQPKWISGSVLGDYMYVQTGTPYYPAASTEMAAVSGVGFTMVSLNAKLRQTVTDRGAVLLLTDGTGTLVAASDGETLRRLEVLYNL